MKLKVNNIVKLIKKNYLVIILIVVIILYVINKTYSSVNQSGGEDNEDDLSENKVNDYYLVINGNRMEFDTEEELENAINDNFPDHVHLEDEIDLDHPVANALIEAVSKLHNCEMMNESEGQIGGDPEIKLLPNKNTCNTCFYCKKGSMVKLLIGYKIPMGYLSDCSIPFINEKILKIDD